MRRQKVEDQVAQLMRGGDYRSAMSIQQRQERLGRGHQLENENWLTCHAAPLHTRLPTVKDNREWRRYGLVIAFTAAQDRQGERQHELHMVPACLCALLACSRCSEAWRCIPHGSSLRFGLGQQEGLGLQLLRVITPVSLPGL